MVIYIFNFSQIAKNSLFLTLNQSVKKPIDMTQFLRCLRYDFDILLVSQTYPNHLFTQFIAYFNAKISDFISYFYLFHLLAELLMFAR